MGESHTSGLHIGAYLLLGKSKNSPKNLVSFITPDLAGFLTSKYCVVNKFNKFIPQNTINIIWLLWKFLLAKDTAVVKTLRDYSLAVKNLS